MRPVHANGPPSGPAVVWTRARCQMHRGSMLVAEVHSHTMGRYHQMDLSTMEVSERGNANQGSAMRVPPSPASPDGGWMVCE